MTSLHESKRLLVHAKSPFVIGTLREKSAVLSSKLLPAKSAKCSMLSKLNADVSLATASLGIGTSTDTFVPEVVPALVEGLPLLPGEVVEADFGPIGALRLSTRSCAGIQ